VPPSRLGGGWGYSGFRGGFGCRSYGYYPYRYDLSPNVTVIYPAPAQAAPSPAYTERANPSAGQYDEYSQEIKSSAEPSAGGAAPIYLLAFTNHLIRAAVPFSLPAP